MPTVCQFGNGNGELTIRQRHVMPVQFLGDVLYRSFIDKVEKCFEFRPALVGLLFQKLQQGHPDNDAARAAVMILFLHFIHSFGDYYGLSHSRLSRRNGKIQVTISSNTR